MIDRTKAKREGIIIDDFIIKASSDDMYLYTEIDFKDLTLIEDFENKWEKIKSELEKEKIKGLLSEPEFVENKIIIAKGKPPKPPVPEKIELFEKFSFLLKENEKECMDTLEDEEEIAEVAQVAEDLRDMCQKIICVEKGEAIGLWYPPIPGTPGINVWGDIIEPPSFPQKFSLTLGENLYVDRYNLIRAKESGVILIDKGKINIYPEYTLREDVDFSTGNVYFTGKKLTIEGDIKFGFKVICKGDLELKGATENKVYIEVNGNFVCDGVVRGKETTVKVEGDAQIKAVEYANLYIKGNLVITNFIIFPNATIYGNFSATSGKGIVYGGEIKCSGDIEANIIGNEDQTTTKLFAGYNPDLIEPYEKALQEKVEKEEILEKLIKGVRLGEKLKKYGRLTKEKEEILIKLKNEIEKCEKSLRKVRENIFKLKKLIEMHKSKTIKVLDKIYSGVILGTANITYEVKEEKRGPITFYLEADTFKLGE